LVRRGGGGGGWVGGGGGGVSRKKATRGDPRNRGDFSFLGGEKRASKKIRSRRARGD